MARVSKKVSAAQREAENAPHRIWKSAIYARLSDFDDVLRDTESLEVQISYIKEHINHRDDLMLLDVFADKRCTGMNFDRPEFERLLKALQERKIDCIVVKDFSRLGRNFVETGQYLEQVFPLFGVRFIAINDKVESNSIQGQRGLVEGCIIAHPELATEPRQEYVDDGYCQKLMKYRVLKKLGPSFNCRFSATAVDSPCKRIPISEELLEHIVRNALTAQIKQAE